MATQTNPVQQTRPRRTSNGQSATLAQNGSHALNPAKLATGLGWFSIGLGLAELLAPRRIQRLTGTSNNKTLIRGFGLREIASGVGILEKPHDPKLVWSRVAGDAMDLVSLGSALTSRKNDRLKTAGAFAAVAGVTAVDVLCAQRMSRQHHKSPTMAEAKGSIVINHSPEESYRFWRNLESLPQFMQFISRVQVTGDRQSHWVAAFPGGKSVEWDAELTEDVPDRRIAWRSSRGSDVYHFGAVDFEPAPGGRGTVVKVRMNYGGPGTAAAVFAKLAGKSPEQILHKDLKRFKQLIETGEIITTEGQPAGRSNGMTWLDEMAH
ncbi:MAG TPA: SRPBCC family protein [Bryobacteraceae bacterium]|jgi:uncharacterized membrane protein|nr:SRPBCC family protein [Bryobacteraceae bacterium]